ncbi:nucleotide-binding protein [Actinokineospora sp. PR83]|uniref:TIR domain-containing protein n=1 Tax=Actinokineospora sp. PR83 TaxID=2884908 RepID=UPI0027E0F39E|nr:nucleotide-binding protein [Actinokineospora sp. PR83]MCG8918591.1 nucleotide-binding protein [Actinokineospora sp. PR83]
MSVRYTPGIYTAGTDFAPYRVSGVRKVISILEAAKLEIELSGGLPEPLAETVETGSDIFLVHGHDDAKKHQVARFLRSLTKREPIVLHEQSSAGNTLIEKFEKYASSVAYAVVLATKDDLGKAKDEDVLKPRARQNVVFELGFFFGALGRAKVALVYEDGVENPGDVSGIAYVPLDESGAWKMYLAREIEQSGVGVEWSAVRP